MVNSRYKQWLRKQPAFRDEQIELMPYEPEGLCEGARMIKLASASAGTPPANFNLTNLTTDLSTITAQNLEYEMTAAASAHTQQSLILEQSVAAARIVGEALKVDTTGTIGINDASIPLNQNAVVRSLYDKDSEALKELERLLNCKIRLLSQLRPDQVEGQLILISHQELPAYADLNPRYIDMVSVAPGITADYIPVTPLVCMARVLISGVDAQEIERILNTDSFYERVFGTPLTQAAIKEFVSTGSFKLPLPTYNYKGAERKQRLSLAAAIAA
ncbi:MAG: hypothetical protein HQ558_03730 [Candidatus Omnitrophica bacterium]|nr:hypothetical protein [Candidatus Omnitrophota bacterium]